MRWGGELVVLDPLSSLIATVTSVRPSYESLVLSKLRLLSVLCAPCKEHSVTCGTRELVTSVSLLYYNSESLLLCVLI